MAFEPVLPPPMRSGPGVAYVRAHDIAAFGTETPNTLAGDFGSSSVSGPFTRLEVQLSSVKDLVEVAVLHQELPNTSFDRGASIWLLPRRLQVYPVPDET